MHALYRNPCLYNKGTITTPFDCTVRNDVDRFHLVIEVCNQIERGNCVGLDEETRWSAVYVKQDMHQKLVKHRQFINEFGVDLDEVQNWNWDVGCPISHRPSNFGTM
jgi:xylulose-5-phosphate/fructose-6-phosphate phosphoketolase